METAGENAKDARPLAWGIIVLVKMEHERDSFSSNNGKTAQRERTLPMRGSA
jgi:hypothetical protein